MATQQDYINKSIKERICLKNIFQKLTTEFDWKLYLTPEDGYELYDGFITKFQKDTGIILNTYFVEIKVRDTHYSDLLLENDKYTNLTKLAKQYDSRNYLDTPSEIIYISVTPEGSYWFNLSKIDFRQVEWLSEEHWASSTDRSKGKIMKKVCYLSTDISRQIKVKSNDIANNDEAVIKRVLLVNKQTSGLYKFLFGN